MKSRVLLLGLCLFSDNISAWVVITALYNRGKYKQAREEDRDTRSLGDFCFPRGNFFA